MICDGCGDDKTVTVLTRVTMPPTTARNGAQHVESRERRLCVGCGGAMSADEASEVAGAVVAQPTLAAVKATSKNIRNQRGAR